MRGKRLIRLMVAALLLFVFAGWQLKAEQAASSRADSAFNPETIRLYHLSDELYQQSHEGNRQLAYRSLLRLDSLSRVAEVRKQYGSDEGWQAVDDVAKRLEQVIQSGKPHGQLWFYSSQLMLAYEALAQDEQALWLSYKEVLQEDVRRVFLAWKQLGSQHSEAALAALKPLEDHVQLIAPAALMQREPALVRSVTESLSYSRSLLQAAATGSADQRWAEASFQTVSAAINQLFIPPEGEGAEPVFTPVYLGMPWRWTFLIGFVVLSVLTYSGWRKFKYEQDRIVPRTGLNRD
ncbi:sporulation protein YpjB [Paenibacillus sp. GCM10012307]|uniref:Sporulation protein YpjB n=1 Tax=Paenibacillus roseus TaxID=2798579 RepID=A0A934J632_9BACL|nr:sporulation protein YpjB [Paenibacillus roseus]MBJ6363555.1 hypothetical protein [Paenibacillus roseus]